MAQEDATSLYKHFLKCRKERLESYFYCGTLEGKSWKGCRTYLYFSVSTVWDTISRSEFVTIADQANSRFVNRFKVEASLPQPHVVASSTLSQDELINMGIRHNLMNKSANVLFRERSKHGPHRCWWRDIGSLRMTIPPQYKTKDVYWHHRTSLYLSLRALRPCKKS